MNLFLNFKGAKHLFVALAGTASILLFASSSSRSSDTAVSSEVSLSKTQGSANMNIKKYDIPNSPAAALDLDEIKIDVSYKLHVPRNWWDGMDVSPSYDKLMNALHGKNIWKDDGRLQSHINALGITGTNNILGSPLGGSNEDLGILEKLLLDNKPSIFIEIGVFKGATSTKVAKFFKKTQGFENSYVISMDTWIQDIIFQRNGQKSRQGTDSVWYRDNRLAGGSTMYYQFLANCLETQSEDRIIPLPTASSNGAYALLAHGVRPDFMYIDASHANPDVFIDYENFYNILRPGGLLAIDDFDFPSVKAAFTVFTDRYDLEIITLPDKKNQPFIIKPHD